MRVDAIHNRPSVGEIEEHQGEIKKIATRHEVVKEQGVSAAHIPDAASRVGVNRAVAGQARADVVHGHVSGTVAAPLASTLPAQIHRALPGPIGMVVDIKV